MYCQMLKCPPRLIQFQFAQFILTILLTVNKISCSCRYVTEFIKYQYNFSLLFSNLTIFWSVRIANLGSHSHGKHVK